MIELFKAIIEMGKTLLGMSSELEKESQEKRQRIAEYLEKISITLNEIAESYRAGRIPHYYCGALSEYSESLLLVVEEYIPEEKKIRYERDLHYFSDAWGTPRISGLELTKLLPELQHAAGRYRALANAMRV